MAETSRSSTRTFVLVGVFLLSLVLLAVLLWQRNQVPDPKFCNADGQLGPNGEVYGRDVDQDCQFVDGKGKVIGE